MGMGEAGAALAVLSMGSPAGGLASAAALGRGRVGAALRAAARPVEDGARRATAEVALRRVRSLLREKRLRLADLWKDRRVNELDYTRPDLDPAKAAVRLEGGGSGGKGAFCDMTDYVRGAWAGGKQRDYTRLTWPQFFDALRHVGLSLSADEVAALTWYVRTAGGATDQAASAISPLGAKFVMLDELETAVRVSRRPYVGFSAAGSPLQRAVERTQASSAAEYLPAAMPHTQNSTGMRFAVRRQPQSFQQRFVKVEQPGGR